MLEKIDLNKKIDKEEYKKLMSKLELRLGELQREAKDLKIPIIIVFEGWDTSGKGTLINRLILAMDARGYTCYLTKAPNEEEFFRPFLWRFWTKTPERGKIAVFNRSWYRRVLEDKINEVSKDKKFDKSYDDINSFERQLTDDGNIIIKFFVHISKKEQKKRLKELDKNPFATWRVQKDDWKNHKRYDEYIDLIEEMIAKTGTSYAPWNIIEGHNTHFAEVKVFKTVVNLVEKRINERKNQEKKVMKKLVEKPDNTSTSIIDSIDLSLKLEKDKYEKLLKKYQKRLWELEHQVYKKRIPVVIVYEGCDAAGKGGNIRRLVQALDPRGYNVIPIAAPNDIERAHHYLWRFIKNFPKAGHIAIFDRSWYGRVLVERVEGFCPEEAWRRAYREINEMEESWANFGTVIIKFWLQISKEEQLKRFKERENNPYKKWKITDEDWRNREKWDLYKRAIDEMLLQTSTPHSPWTVIEANSKLYARIKALKTVVESIEKQIKDRGE